ncbi:SHOCT domain-containing protein [Alkalihalobacillus sp. AL-G]|uniref:SHOCT domain-containing protein n=1 Tax=Alkalihalobacillus sp. AL-G TaxID=2926399 RepID=UPI0027299831|nr:SHOCT domain-containing protein [Alkalihalobacillus sp. AL-G]WLD91678.1 SHOCT domain-containing protein [Alkalihalobacillus sp. AL-G]
MHWGFHPIGFIFFILLVGLLISNIMMHRRKYGKSNRDSHNALSILENRLASGEIDTDEYEKIKAILSN